MNDSATFSCQKCSARFPDEEELSFHISERHLFYRPYKCTDCEWTSSSWKQIGEHKELDHPLSEQTVIFFPDPTKSGKLADLVRLHENAVEFCPKCEEWEAPTGGKVTALENLRGHIRGSHFNSKPFSCAHCNVSFASWPLFLVHFKRNHPEANVKITMKFDKKVEQSVSDILSVQKPEGAMVWNSKEPEAASSLDSSIIVVEETPFTAQNIGLPTHIKVEPEDPPMMVDLNVQNLTGSHASRTTDIADDEVLNREVPDLAKTKKERLEDVGSYNQERCEQYRDETQKNFLSSEKTGEAKRLTETSEQIPSRLPEQASELSESSLDPSNFSLGSLEGENRDSLHEPLNLSRSHSAQLAELRNDEPSIKTEIPAALFSRPSTTARPALTSESSPDSETDDLSQGEDWTDFGSTDADAIRARKESFTSDIKPKLVDEGLEYGEPESQFSIKTEIVESEAPERFVVTPTQLTSEKYNCNLCCKEVENTDERKKEHVWTNHLGNPQAVKCPECAMTSEHQIDKIQDHVERCHPHSTKSIIDLTEEYSERLTQVMKVCFAAEELDKVIPATTAPKEAKQLPRNRIECAACSTLIGIDTFSKQAHIWVHHIGNPRAYKCPDCDAEFGYYKDNARNHFKSKHGKTDWSELVDLRPRFEEDVKKQFPVCFGHEKVNVEATKALKMKSGPKLRGKVKRFCMLCEKNVAINVKSGRTLHVWRNHLENPQCLKCPNCSYTTGRIKKAMVKHIQRLHPDKDSNDAIDTRETLSQPLKELYIRCFRRSIKKSTNDLRRNKKFCHLCKKDYSDSDDFAPLDHVWSVHMGDPVGLTCSLCDFTAPRQIPIIRAHLIKSHQSKKAKEFADNRSEYYDELSEKFQLCFKTYIRGKSGVGHIQCKLCYLPVPFATRRTLETHIWKRHIEVENAIACSACPFSTKFNLAEMKHHIGENHPQLCNGGFMDERPRYENEVERKFMEAFGPNPQKQERKDSVLKAKSGKEWRECQVCRENVAYERQSSDLKRHVWTEHMGDPKAVRCLKCDFCSSYEVKKIRKHLKKFHPDSHPDSFKDDRESFTLTVLVNMEKCFPKQRNIPSDSIEAEACALCGERVRKGTDTFRRHIWRSHLGNPRSSECGMCRATFGFDYSTGITHMKNRHPKAGVGQLKDKRSSYQIPTKKLMRICFPATTKKKRSTAWSSTNEVPNRKNNLGLNRTSLEDRYGGSTHEKMEDNSSTYGKTERTNVPKVSGYNRIQNSAQLLDCHDGQETRKSNSHEPEDNKSNLPNVDALIVQSYQDAVTPFPPKKKKKSTHSSSSELKVQIRTCQMCQATIEEGADNARKHVWISHMKNPKAFSCKICCFAVTLKRNHIVNHAIEAHSLSTNDEITDSYTDTLSELKEVYSRLKQQCFS